VKYITTEYILKLHEKLILTTGGSGGIRDIELLKSSIENSKVTFGGEDLYKTIEGSYFSMGKIPHSFDSKTNFSSKENRKTHAKVIYKTLAEKDIKVNGEIC